MGGLRPPKRERGAFQEWLEYTPREGTRGGQGQFSWEKVANDKSRVFYVANSLKCSKARSNMGKDLFWWQQNHKHAGSSIEEERRQVRKQEKEAMEAMLQPASHNPRISKEKPARL